MTSGLELERDYYKRKR